MRKIFLFHPFVALLLLFLVPGSEIRDPRSGIRDKGSGIRYPDWVKIRIRDPPHLSNLKPKIKEETEGEKIDTDNYFPPLISSCEEYQMARSVC